MASQPLTYRGYRFPPEVISHAVWLYHRFGLSLRDVEDLLAERGITVTYEAIRQWCLAFGLDYAHRLLRTRAFAKWGPRLSLPRLDRHRHPLRAHLLQPQEDQPEHRVRRPERGRQTGEREHLARQLHALRSGVGLRFKEFKAVVTFNWCGTKAPRGYAGTLASRTERGRRRRISPYVCVPPCSSFQRSQAPCTFIQNCGLVSK